MEVNNFGTHDHQEFYAVMDSLGATAYKENYRSKKDYIRTTFEIEEFLIQNFNGQQYKLIRYIIYRSFRSPSHYSLWMKATNEEIAKESGISFETIKNTLGEFEKMGIIKRYKRHPRDKQHIVIMPLKDWKFKKHHAKQGLA